MKDKAEAEEVSDSLRASLHDLADVPVADAFVAQVDKTAPAIQKERPQLKKPIQKLKPVKAPPSLLAAAAAAAAANATSVSRRDPTTGKAIPPSSRHVKNMHSGKPAHAQ